MFYLDQISTVALPLIEARQDVSSGTSLSAFRQMQSGGAYRVLGSERAMRQMQLITATGDWFVDHAVDMTALGKALYAERGKLAKLYRREYGTSARHWCWAELVRVGVEISPPTARPGQMVQPVTPEFQMVSPSWYGVKHGPAWLWAQPMPQPDQWGSGVAWSQATGDTFVLPITPGPTHAVVNGGNAPVDNAILRITAGAAALNTLSITSYENGQVRGHLLFDVPVPAGATLVIDCGARSVMLGGISRYADFRVADDHRLAGWLRLYPGTTTLAVTYTTTTAASLMVEYNDGYE
jgi:hypothetical protein